MKTKKLSKKIYFYNRKYGKEAKLFCFFPIANLIVSRKRIHHSFYFL